MRNSLVYIYSLSSHFYIDKHIKKRNKPWKEVKVSENFFLESLRFKTKYSRAINTIEGAVEQLVSISIEGV